MEACYGPVFMFTPALAPQPFGDPVQSHAHTMNGMRACQAASEEERTWNKNITARTSKQQQEHQGCPSPREALLGMLASLQQVV